MNRGSSSCRGARANCRPRFNEAPIHESGKCDIVDQQGRIRGRFNEAPIHESGKYGVGG